MWRTNWKRWWVGAAAGAVAACAGPWVLAQSAPSSEPPAAALPQIKVLAERAGDVIIRLAEASADDGQVNTEVQELPTSEYWIGIALGELPEIAREQLKLDGGLVVKEVMEGSPAAKAEFKPNDILLKAGDAKLSAAADLIKAVDAAKEKELPLVIIRGGKEQVIRVAPIKRPKSEASEEGQRFSLRLPSPDIQADIKKLEEALNKLKEKTGSAPLGLMLARPAVVPPLAARVDALKTAELPKNLTIQITKKGDAPANIRVVRDDKTWEVTEDRLSELPEDIRDHVKQLLGQRALIRYPMGLPGVRYDYGRPGSSPAPAAAPARTLTAPVPPTPPAAPAPPAVPAPPAPPAPLAPARATIRAYAYPPPGTTATPSTPPATRSHTYRIETSGGVEGRLDAILKKLEQLESKSVEQLEKEVQQLRKELDELRGKSPGQRESR